MSNDTEQAGTFGAAAYGGDNWSPRIATHRDEIGDVWACCGIDSEWRPLQAVLLHRPGDELLAAQNDPESAQMLGAVDIDRAQTEHDTLAEAYRGQGIEVHLVEPQTTSEPNLMFCADLFAMTPQGAILARPASTVRAGEERHVAYRLAALGIPILKTLTRDATFEGADLMWIDESSAIIGRGLRTNDAAIDQLETLFAEIGCTLIALDLPFGVMHLMGLLRIVDADLAIAWPRRTPHRCVELLRERGFRVEFPRLVDDSASHRGINFVTLGPRKILMVDGLPGVQSAYEALGIECLTASTEALSRAAGNVGCLTGVLRRALAD